MLNEVLHLHVWKTGTSSGIVLPWDCGKAARSEASKDEPPWAAIKLRGAVQGGEKLGSL